MENHYNECSVFARIERERTGMPVRQAESSRKWMHMPASEFSRILVIKHATYKKKAAEGAVLTGSYGYAVSVVEHILDKARSLLPEDRKDLDIEKWLPSGSRNPSRAWAA